MKKTLILLTSSFPFGKGETFLANEFPYLEEAFDEAIVITNATEGEQVHPLPEGVRCLRMGYNLSGGERALAITGLLHPEVLREIRLAGRQAGALRLRGITATVLTSWFKAQKFGQLIRRLARLHPESRTYAYAYWADDMALAAAMARRNGWVEKALCRAHGWDVYPERSEVGFLPFRAFLAQNLDHVLAVSEDGRRAIQAQLGGEETPSLGVARLGVPGISKEPLGRRDPFTVLSCSSIIPLKRVERIARSLALFPHPARWIHVGDGPERRGVEEACREIPDHVEVEFLGQIPHDRIPDLYRSTRPTILLNLSAWEGLPVTMMEAMSAGVPCVGTDVGGVREIIRDGENGTLLPRDPPKEAVVQALSTFVSLSEEAYNTYAFQARETWRREFDAEANYTAFLKKIVE